MHTDMSLSELQSYWDHGVLEHDTTLHPACATWPMGFSWSSFLAQSLLLQRCVEGGLDRKYVDDIDTGVVIVKWSNRLVQE